MVLYVLVESCMVLFGLAWYFKVFYGTVLSCMVLHGLESSFGIAWSCSRGVHNVKQAGIELGLNQAETVSLELTN